MFNQQEFNQFVLQNNVIGIQRESITLKSGRQSYFYVNWRTPMSDAFLLDHIASFVAVVAQKVGADTIYGVPEGATKLGIVASLRLAQASSRFGVGSHVIPMGRAKPKEHGDTRDKYFVGMPVGKTIVLEDVTTTGGSLIDTVDTLLESHINVIAVITLTNRMEKRSDGLSVEQTINDRYKGRIKYIALSNAIELLPIVIQRDKPDSKIVEALQTEFDN